MAILTIDYAMLVKHLEEHRARRGASWRQIAAEIGVPPGTFTRVKNGQGMSADTFVTLMNLLETDNSIRPFLKDGRRSRLDPVEAVSDAEE